CVSLILESIDRIKLILEALERDGVEPKGSDAELIGKLQALALAGDPTLTPAHFADAGRNVRGHAGLDELERSWRETPGPELEAPQPLSAEAAGTNGKEGQARAQ